jgi:hypothetical protein
LSSMKGRVLSRGGLVVFDVVCWLAVVMVGLSGG